MIEITKEVIEMVNNIQINQIAENIKNNEYDFGYIAIRVSAEGNDDYMAKIGDVLPASWQWNDGEYTDNRLNGTCGINRTARLNNKSYAGYSGDRVFIIGGDEAEQGEDAGELIIKNAIVLDIINF